MEGAHHDRGRGLGCIGKSVRWGGKTDTRKVERGPKSLRDSSQSTSHCDFLPVHPP